MADLKIKIDKDVPLPDDTRSRSNYPFADMEVGDSIFIPLEEGDNAQRMKNRLSQATRTFGKKQDPEQLLPHGIPGIRVALLFEGNR